RFRGSLRGIVKTPLTLPWKEDKLAVLVETHQLQDCPAQLLALDDFLVGREGEHRVQLGCDVGCCGPTDWRCVVVEQGEETIVEDRRNHIADSQTRVD